MTIVMVAGAGILYLAGWLAMAGWFATIRGPTPVPGRFARDLGDALAWPAWLALFVIFRLLTARRQAFEAELQGGQGKERSP